MKLFFRIVPLIVIPIIIFAIAYQLTFAYILSDTILDSTIMEAKGIIDITAGELENPVYFLDVDEITSVIENVESAEWIISAVVLDSQGMVITDGTNENPNVGKIPEDRFTLDAIASNEIMYTVNGDILHVAAPIIITERLGTVHMDFSLEDYQTIVQDSGDSIITITLSIALLSAMFAFFFSRNITTQIQKMKKLSHNIAEGDFESKIEESNIEEIEQLGNDLKVMAQRLENTKDDLVKSERLSSIGELSARLAHDLRNPLSVIKNSVYVLENHMGDKKDEKITKYMSVLREEVDRMSHQINEVLGFVKTRPMQIEPFQVQQLLKDALPGIIPKNVTIQLPENDVTIHGDKEQLLIVFRNIIQNSIQAIGEKEGKITLRIDEDDNYFLIDFEDNGPGIPTNILDRIFEPLYTTKQEGTGLGLVTCKTVVEQHGGNIKVTNNPDGGVTFTIMIPKNGHKSRTDL